jgi:cytochrome c-type biogenesis protein CcmH
MFWLIVAGMTILTAVAVIWPLLQAGRSVPKGAELDLQVYKDQLSEVDREVDRGVLSQAQADAARLEVSRRMLEADKRVQLEVKAERTSRGITFVTTGVIALALIGGAFGLYGLIGSPGVPDQPLMARIEAAQVARANRPGQAAAEAAAPRQETEIAADYLALIEKLRAAVASRPTDMQGQRLLVHHEANTGNFAGARKAQQQVIALLGADADANDFTDLAEFMILAAGGYVSPEAETALSDALKRDSKLPRARYYSGLFLAQTGRPDIAYRMWINLLEEGPQDAPWVEVIRLQIPDVARAAGVRLPDFAKPRGNLSGPSAAQVGAAESMSEAERQDLIGNMVQRLSERLATEGGEPVEWARLIRAYGVLGETAKASAIWNEARETFKETPQALNMLEDAARAARIIN